MLNFKKPSRTVIIAAAAVLLVAALSVWFAVNRGGGANPFQEPPEDDITAAVDMTVGLAAGTVTADDPEPPVEPGIISGDIKAEGAVLDAALDWVKGDYEGFRDVGLAVQRENGAVFDNWRLEYIEHVHTYDGIGIDVYRFGWRVHTSTPEKIILAGGMEIDADGWLLDTYPNSWYLLFENSWDELKFLTAMMANDCAPGDELFTIDMIRLLEGPPDDPGDTTTDGGGPILPTPTPTPEASQPDNMLDKIYLGMTGAEVYELFGEPDFHASGLMWFGYNGVGVFDPSFGFNGSIGRISLEDGKSWSVHELISAAVKQRKPGAGAGEVPFEWHEIVDLEADKRGFTVSIISKYEYYLPDGEYDVLRTAWEYSHIELSFVKDANYDYALASYSSDDNVWLMGMAPGLMCYDQAMYHFVGAIPSSGRFSIGAGTALISHYAESLTPNGEFLIRYFPGAALSIEADVDHATNKPGGWIIEYADPSKNITVGKNGAGEIPITDDMIGIYDADRSGYAMKFEKYVKAG